MHRSTCITVKNTFKKWKIFWDTERCAKMEIPFLKKTWQSWWVTPDKTESKHWATVMELKEEIDRLIPDIQGYGTTMSMTEELGWQKISKEMQCWNSTINQFDVFVNCRIVHSSTAEFTFFSIAHKIFVSRLYPNY